MALEIWRCGTVEEHAPHEWIKPRDPGFREDPRYGPWRVRCMGEFCNECDGPYTPQQGGDEQYAGHWDTCPNRWKAKDRRDAALREQALIDDEVTLGMVSKSPEFGLAEWFTCLMLGHKWKWLVRYVPATDNPATTDGVRPVAERCKRCGVRRPLNIFRWSAFVSGDMRWERGL